MTTLPNGITVEPDEEWFWKLFDYRCTAHPHKYAACIHHFPPRSRNPHWNTDPLTWYLLCNECHRMVHELNPLDEGFFLESNRKRFYPNAEAQINDAKS